MSSAYSPTNNKKSTALFDQHRQLNAKFDEYAGWTMPIYYDGIQIEYRAVLDKCGLFDVSHMGQFFISGANALNFLRYLLPLRTDRLSIGQLQYTPMCNVTGGTVDDLIVYRIGERDFLLVVNASRTSVDWEWIKGQSQTFSDLNVRDRSDKYCILAVQGPLSKKIVREHTLEPAGSLKYFDFIESKFASIPVILSRNGYTGEDGFEIIVESKNVEDIWEVFIAAGAIPCGLASRDILRIEMGFALYGNELSEELTPLDGGIGWTIDWPRSEEFIGGVSLQERRLSGKHGRIIGIEMLEKGIPRSGYRVFDQKGVDVGVVTSGTQSPILEKGIALVRLHHSVVCPANNLFVDIRGKLAPVRVRKLPFRRSKVRKSSG